MAGLLAPPWAAPQHSLGFHGVHLPVARVVDSSPLVADTPCLPPTAWLPHGYQLAEGTYTRLTAAHQGQLLLSTHVGHAGLEAEQGAGARWHGGQQQHQGQGHRSSRGPRLRKDRHLAGGPAPGPSSGPQLTRGRREPPEPPTPRAPWPGWGPGAHRAQPQVPLPDPPSPRSLQVQRVRLPARALGAAET